jgi:hypothetical protein
MRAATVVADGVRPDVPMPCAWANTSAGVTRSGVLPTSSKNGQRSRP